MPKATMTVAAKAMFAQRRFGSEIRFIRLSLDETIIGMMTTSSAIHIQSVWGSGIPCHRNQRLPLAAFCELTTIFGLKEQADGRKQGHPPVLLQGCSRPRVRASEKL
jgi:hypothetical protein